MLKAFFAAAVAAAFVLQASPKPATDLPLNQIKLPPGFSINVFATGVTNARSLTHGTKGTLFVGSRSVGKKVYALTYKEGSATADRVVTIASGLQDPQGVAFRDGALYVAEVSR